MLPHKRNGNQVAPVLKVLLTASLCCPFHIHMTLSSPLGSFLFPTDGDSKFLQNYVTSLLSYMASYSRRL